MHQRQRSTSTSLPNMDHKTSNRRGFTSSTGLKVSRPLRSLCHTPVNRSGKRTASIIRPMPTTMTATMPRGRSTGTPRVIGMETSAHPHSLTSLLQLVFRRVQVTLWIQSTRGAHPGKRSVTHALVLTTTLLALTAHMRGTMKSISKTRMHGAELRTGAGANRTSQATYPTLWMHEGKRGDPTRGILRTTQPRVARLERTSKAV